MHAMKGLPDVVAPDAGSRCGIPARGLAVSARVFSEADVQHIAAEIRRIDAEREDRDGL